MNYGLRAGDTVHSQFVRLDECASPTEDNNMTRPEDNTLRFYHFLCELAKSEVKVDYEAEEKRRWDSVPRLPAMTREEVTHMAQRVENRAQEMSARYRHIGLDPTSPEKHLILLPNLHKANPSPAFVPLHGCKTPLSF